MAVSASTVAAQSWWSQREVRGRWWFNGWAFMGCVGFVFVFIFKNFFGVWMMGGIFVMMKFYARFSNEERNGPWDRRMSDFSKRLPAPSPHRGF
jgi:hypothetical protein